MKSTFFSNISHEFRTPLTLILGPIQILKEHISDTKLNYHLDAMKRSADRLLKLINQLLDLSKLESGKMNLSLHKVDLITLVKGITMTFQSLTETKNINLSVSSKLSGLIMNVDQQKLRLL